jgi:xanthine dehydrogenase YagR molybdenum-binding subunit
MSIVGDSVQGESQTATPLGPESWEPGNEPDPLIRHEHGLIGAPVSRLDGALKVTGAARFAADVQLDGMVYAALAFSTIARGRLATLETGAAEEARGVVLVMTYKNAPRMKPIPLFMTSAKAAGGDDLPVMQDDRIHWNGQPIALVLAETQEEADHAS